MNPLSITEERINKELQLARIRAIYLCAQMNRFQKLATKLGEAMEITETEVIKGFDRLIYEFQRIFFIRDMSGNLSDITTVDDPLLMKPKVSLVWNSLIKQLEKLSKTLLMIGENQWAIAARRSIKIFLKIMFIMPDFSGLLDVFSEHDEH